MSTTTRSRTQKSRTRTELEQRAAELEALGLEIVAGQPRRGASAADPAVSAELVDEAVDRAVGRRRVRQALGVPSDRRISNEVIDELLAGASTEEEIVGPGGLLAELTRRLVERAMEVELTDHVGYEPHQEPPGGAGNTRNGTTPKTLVTEHGKVPIDAPRDRDGSFEPKIVKKRQRRFVGFDEEIYLGPLSGRSGAWTSIDVPAHGQHTVGHVRACPRARRHCFVMNTIAHSTMGDLVVGNYDLNPSVPGGVISANAFIYSVTRHQWTLLRLGGSLSSKTTLYGIWQNGGPASPDYTLAGGSSAHGSSPRGNQRAFVMNYNERTGAFGKPKYYTYGNAPALVTHFEGITAVPGGFNLVAVSSAEAASMAFVPVTGRFFGRATWYPIDVAASPLCPGGCSVVTGNTVYKNRVMGLYVQAGSPTAHTYLASVSTR